MTAHLVAHGLGVALVPRLAALSPALPLVRVRCAGRPHRKFLTCTRAGGDRRPAVAAALAELRALAATAVT
ncbi:LysR family transcriptional regulator OS=Streptomyces fumanus OX=67302 GN=GCM10018772_56060 PE=3 SV=1 [Streptomyces fumanus]